MKTSGDDSDNTAVAGTLELETAGQPRLYKAMSRGDEVRGVLAKGTCEQPPLTRAPGVTAMPAQGARAPAPAVHTWSQPSGRLEERSGSARSAAPAGGRRAEAKIVLAHLALDLYREIEGQTVACDAHPVQPDAAAVCTNPGCEARINALRGSLVEACLLIQRVLVMAAPEAKAEAKGEVEDRIRELLERMGR